MSVREAARLLGLSTASVYKLCSQGMLRHVRFLNAIRVAPADLGAFIAAQRRGGAG